MSGLASEQGDPFLRRLGDDLERAVEDTIRRRSAPRRRLPGAHPLRVALVGLAAVALLGGTALAAGGAFGVIDLGGGVSAEQVESAPEWNGLTGAFVDSSANGDYVYHVVGGSAFALACPGEPFPVNNMYVTSTRPLSESELSSLLSVELDRRQIPANALKRQLEAELLTHRRSGRGSAATPALPPGVISVSNGCSAQGAGSQAPSLTELSPAAHQLGSNRPAP